MKNDDSNISNVFRDKLGQYAETPPAHVWDGVQGQLNALRKKRRIAALGRVAAAAVIVLAFLAGWYLNGERQNTATENAEIMPAVQQENTQNETEPMAPAESHSLQPEELTASNNTVETARNTSAKPVIPVPAGKTENVASDEAVPLLYEKVQLARLPYGKARIAEPEKQYAQLTISSPETENVLTENDRILLAQNVLASHRETAAASFEVGVSIAPGFSSHTSDHSASYAQDMMKSDPDLNGNLSGAVSFRVKTGKRLSIESGLVYAQNGRKSGAPSMIAMANNSAEHDALTDLAQSRFFNASVQLAEDNSLKMNSVAGVIQFDKLPQGTSLAATPEMSYSADNRALLTDGNFSQVFDFVEIPLYLRYLLLDAAIDVEISGGINAGLIVGNNAYIENSYGIQNIGRTRDISSLNFSGAVGVGLNYDLGSNLSVNLEPRFSYYLNSINKSAEVDYRPYRVGIYTGLFYSF